MISAVVVTKLCDSKLQSCLHSLQNQKCMIPFEIVVIHSGREKQCIEGVRYFHYPGMTVGMQRNKGIEHSRYDMIAFLDADCVAGKSWLMDHYLYHEKTQGPCIAGGRTLAKKGIPGFTQEQIDNSRFHKQKIICVPTCNLSMKKSTAEKAGLFKDFMYGEDLEFCWRAHRKGIQLEFLRGGEVFHDISPGLFDLLRRSHNYGRGHFNTARIHAHPQLKAIRLGLRTSLFFVAPVDFVSGLLRFTVPRKYLLLQLFRLGTISGYLTESLRS